MTVEELEDRITKLDAQLGPRLDALSQQEKYRKQLTDEYVALMAQSPRIRDPKLVGRRINLELSIKAIDRGLSVFDGTGYELSNCRLGELMKADGVEPVGADPARFYAGIFPWPGSTPQLQREVKELTTRRDALAKKLAEATLSDAERAERDAANAEYARVYNSMRVTGSDDGRYLVAKARDGRELEMEELTPEQRAALQRANAEYARS